MVSTAVAATLAGIGLVAGGVTWTLWDNGYLAPIGGPANPPCFPWEACAGGDPIKWAPYGAVIGGVAVLALAITRM